MANTTLGTREKLGYACGEMGNTIVFSFVNSIIQKYYTDVVGLTAASVMILFIVARIWDAINDPIWGGFMDSRKPTASGRYKKWMVRMAVPLALAVVFLFVRFPGLSQSQCLVYAYASYIMFGMMYTTTQIPYGSLSSVMTNDPDSTSQLSLLRSVGGVVIGLFPMIVCSMIFTTKNGVTSYNGSLMRTSSIVFSCAMVVFYVICYFSVTERIRPADRPRQKGRVWTIIGFLFKDRAFIAICIAGMLLLASNMFTQTYYLYLFNSYFNASGLYLAVNVATYLPIIFVLPFMGKIVRKIGKSEICAGGMLFAGAVQVILYFIHTSSPWVFIAFTFISSLGMVFFILEVWAMVNDVIDYVEVKKHFREEATTYAFFMFTRKLGQTIAGILATAALIWIKYQSGSAVQTAETVSGMYSIAIIIPAVLYIAIGLVLWLMYPITRSEMEKLQVEKEAIRGKV
ncbi:MAG: MFS transporter [Sphaerochaetaceae bacterium]